MKKSIALVWPKSTFLNDPTQWPPLGLFYLSSQLEAQGHTTEFFDLSFDELPEDGQFDQLWLSSTSPQIKETKRIAEITKNWSKTNTCLGGAGAWASPETHKVLSFDLIVAGESDHPDTIRKLVEMVDDPLEGQFTNIPISRTLDWVLPPNRRWSTKYHSYMNDKQGNKYRMATLFTTRGCPMECAFCESGRHGVIWDRLTRYESLDIVEYQIKECKELGFTGLAYYDDVLILNKKRTLSMMELHRQYDMKFRCFLRSDIVCKQGGKEYLQQLYDGGLIEIFVGVESADNEIKNNIHKGTSIEQDTLILNWCKEIGINCKMSFILGLPGESLDSMNKTRDWILKNRPDRTQVDRLIPFPGTPLTDKSEEYDLVYETKADDEFFYRAKRGLEYPSFVSTSHLSVEQIDTFWKKLEIELEQQDLHG